MDKRFLKNALFGYSKTSVCEYIAQVNEEFSNRLLSLTDEHKKEKNELKSKMEVLETELAEYKRVHGDITTALVEARKYATTLKQQAEEDDRRMREENAEKYKVQETRLSSYITEIEELREQLTHFVANTEKQLQGYLQSANDIASKYEIEKENDS